MVFNPSFTKSTFLQYAVDAYADGTFTVSDIDSAYDAGGVSAVADLMDTTGLLDRVPSAAADIVDTMNGVDIVKSILTPEGLSPSDILDIAEVVVPITADLQGMIASLDVLPIPSDYASILNAVASGPAAIKSACQGITQGLQACSTMAGAALCASKAGSYQSACSNALQGKGMPKPQADAAAKSCAGGSCGGAGSCGGGSCGGSCGGAKSGQQKSCMKQIYDDIQKPPEEKVKAAEWNMALVAIVIGGCPGFCSLQAAKDEEAKVKKEEQKVILENPPACKGKCGGGCKSSCGGCCGGGCGGAKKGCGGTPCKPKMKMPSPPSAAKKSLMEKFLENMGAGRIDPGKIYLPDPVQTVLDIADAVTGGDGQIFNDVLDLAGIGIEPGLLIMEALGIDRDWMTRVGTDALSLGQSIKRISDTVGDGTFDIPYAVDLFDTDRSYFDDYLYEAGFENLNPASSQDIVDLISARNAALVVYLLNGVDVSYAEEAADILSSLPTLIQGVLVTGGVQSQYFSPLLSTVRLGPVAVRDMLIDIGTEPEVYNVVEFLVDYYQGMAINSLEQNEVLNAEAITLEASGAACEATGAVVSGSFGGSCGGCCGGTYPISP